MLEEVKLHDEFNILKILIHLSFYSANGKLKTILSTKLPTGSHLLKFERGTLVRGVYFVEIKSAGKLSKEKSSIGIKLTNCCITA